MLSQATIHGNILNTKKDNSDDLRQAYTHYCEFREVVDELVVRDEENIKILVDAMNQYRRNVVNIFENRSNSGQEGFRSTILEEFFYFLFKDLVSEYIDLNSPNIVLGKANSYVSLSFTPVSFSSLFNEPRPYIHTKDQDFVLGCSAKVKVTPVGNQDSHQDENDIVIPVLAIECKTYLERNMLDSCAGTARRIKAAMPYCLYIVASEYLKMDDASPELTDIDEVYILCKARNSDREAYRRDGRPPHEMDSELVIDLYNMVRRHFNSIWWDPASALIRGKIIGRP